MPGRPTSGSKNTELTFISHRSPNMAAEIFLRVKTEPGNRSTIRSHGANASTARTTAVPKWTTLRRSEEHTSELQSRLHLVCRLLLEKKKTCKYTTHSQGTMN